MKKDLGTYHLRVELEDGRGWIERWTTGARLSHGTDSISPLKATLIPPNWKNEEELLQTMRYSALEGNMSCDCNKVISLARAAQEDEPEEPSCGDTLKLKRLTVLCPDGRYIELNLNE